MADSPIDTKSRSLIAAGQHALIRLPSDGLKIALLRPENTITLGKFGAFKVESIIGHPFGTSFEINADSEAVPIKSMKYNVEDEEKEGEEDNEQEALTQFFSVSADSNQDIINIGLEIQALDSQQIDELKKSGASSATGQLIIKQIIAGHGGFDKKTMFAQQKYLRRKQQKFLRRFQVEYLGASQLLNYYVDKDVSRVLDMSEELLGFLLASANVRPGGSYLVMDDTGGVIIYAMLERMKGEGQILLVHENEHPNLATLRYSDYLEEYQQKMIKTLSWLQFADPELERIDWQTISEEEYNELRPSKQLQYKRRLKRAAEINSALDLVQNSNFDALVCVSTLLIPSLLSHVIPRVGGSRPVVFYSPFKEHLLEAQHALTVDRRVLAPSIYETRARAYQTIQGRLHPLMTLRGYGGYVLTGTRVFSAEGINAVGKGTRKKPKVEAKVEPKGDLVEKNGVAETKDASVQAGETGDLAIGLSDGDDEKMME